MNKWDYYFLDLAEHISTMSKDPDHQVGAVIIDEKNRIVSTGFNGPPRGVLDDYDTKEEKLARTIHAEINAIIFARRDLSNCSIYIHPFYPCSTCTAVIIQCGIKRIIARKDKISTKWNPLVTIDMCDEAGVALEALNDI